MTTFLDRVVAERRADAIEAAARAGDPASGALPPVAGPPPRSLSRAIRSRRPAHLAVIAEVKRRSPAARSERGGGGTEDGVLSSDRLAAPSLDVARLARQYEDAGAAAISVLTEPRHWGGSLDDLTRVREAVDIPVICKDVVVHEIQVIQARGAGADAVLLIAEALSDEELGRLTRLIHSLRMEPLIEAHDIEAFGRAVRAGATVVGANARDLRDPSVIDRSRARLLHTFVRPDQLFVAESGISSAGDLAELPERVDAVLVGTALMRSARPELLVHELATYRVGQRAGRAETVVQ